MPDYKNQPRGDIQKMHIETKYGVEYGSDQHKRELKRVRNLRDTLIRDNATEKTQKKEGYVKELANDLLDYIEKTEADPRERNFVDSILRNATLTPEQKVAALKKKERELKKKYVKKEQKSTEDGKQQKNNDPMPTEKPTEPKQGILINWWEITKWAWRSGWITLFRHRIKPAILSILSNDMFGQIQKLINPIKYILNERFDNITALEYNLLICFLDLAVALRKFTMVEINTPFLADDIESPLKTLAHAYYKIIFNKMYRNAEVTAIAKALRGDEKYGLDASNIITLQKMVSYFHDENLELLIRTLFMTHSSFNRIISSGDVKEFLGMLTFSVDDEKANYTESARMKIKEREKKEENERRKKEEDKKWRETLKVMIREGNTYFRKLAEYRTANEEEFIAEMRKRERFPVYYAYTLFKSFEFEFHELLSGNPVHLNFDGDHREEPIITDPEIPKIMDTLYRRVTNNQDYRTLQSITIPVEENADTEIDINHARALQCRELKEMIFNESVKVSAATQEQERKARNLMKEPRSLFFNLAEKLIAQGRFLENSNLNFYENARINFPNESIIRKAPGAILNYKNSDTNEYFINGMLTTVKDAIRVMAAMAYFIAFELRNANVFRIIGEATTFAEKVLKGK